MITAGCDLGSATGKVVILKDDEILSSFVASAKRNPELTAQLVMKEALSQAGLASISDLDHIIGTGYGRTNVFFIKENMSEITCHAHGAHWLHSSVRTVIDIGGQDCKVISIDSRGKVLDFGMNDKCAAGTGRFFEAMARALDCTLDELSELAMQSDNPENITKQCSVFAESEVVTLINNGVNIADISAGIHKSIARRIHSMVNRVGVNPDIVLTGGCARNEGIIKYLQIQLGLELVRLPQNPQIAGALGAALIARKRAVNSTNCGEVYGSL